MQQYSNVAMQHYSDTAGSKQQLQNKAFRARGHLVKPWADRFSGRACWILPYHPAATFHTATVHFPLCQLCVFANFANFHITSIHQYINTSIHPYIHTSCIHTFIHPCIHTSIHPYIHISIYPYIHISIHPCIHTSIHPYIHISYIHISIDQYIHISLHP